MRALNSKICAKAKLVDRSTSLIGMWWWIGVMIVLQTLMVTISRAQPPAFDYRGDDERISAEITLDVTAGKYEIVPYQYRVLKQKQTGSLVRMKRFNTTTSAGDPALPVRIYEIALPPNIDWKTLKLTVEASEAKTLPETYDLLPAPPGQARVDDKELVDWGEGKDIVDGRNMNVYGKDEYYPREPARIVSQSQMRKWRFVRVEYSPVQYNPVKKTVRLTPSAKLRLDFKRIGKKVYRSDPLLADDLMDKEAARRFENFKEAKEWYRYVPEQRSGTDPADPDYVIITTNAIRDHSARLADFVAHKTTLGYTVQVVTEDDYGTLGNAQAIRNWLIANYAPLGIHYVLLIGNPDPDDPSDPADSVGDVPMIMTWPNRFSYIYRESPTDYYYADLTGNWDLDGDGFFGEYQSVTGATAPDPAVDPDTFSARWTGKIEADTDATYPFATVSDNGIRVRIDGTTVIDGWTSHTVAVHYGSIALTTGQHDIEVEYFEDTDDAVAKLLWRPAGYTYYGVVPSTKLYHLVAGSYVSGGLDAEYFNNTDFTASAITRVDNNINFIWATGDQGAGGVDFDPEVYVGRIPVYDDDYAALDAILQKTIDYETAAPPAWRRGLLTANVELWPDQSDYQLGEALKAFGGPLGYNSYRIYESDFGIVPAPECPAINPKDTDPAAACNMLGEWVNGGGYGLLTWSTHGWSSGASGLIVSADNVHLNDATPAFTFQGSCLNGYTENTDNLGYALLRQGAIGTVSASRVSYNAVFNPALDPNPLSGLNANLTYHYATRMMKDQAAGHALYITKSNVNPSSSWMNKMDFNLYGDPSAALQRTVAGVDLLFDTSGSMSWSHEGVPGVPLAEQRLSLAKEAAYPFMELLNDHAHTRANFGISVFPPHPWSSAVGCNGQVVTPMTRVDDASTATAVSTTIPGLVAEGNTPLLAGMAAAVAAFTTETPRAIVLLSDGYHNCPTVVGFMDPEVDTLVGQLDAASVKVYTIGFGRPTDIDHPLLNRLAVDTDGVFYDVTTSTFDPATWSPATDLQATYKAILVDALGLETAADPMAVIGAGKTDSHEVRINEHDNRVSVFLSWKTPQANRLSLRIKTSDGVDIPATAATPGVTIHQGNTYQIVTLDREFLNQAGKVGPTPWILEVGAGQLASGETEHYQYSVIVDSGLKMNAGFARDDYRVGDPIVIKAAIKVDRRPLTGLSDVVAKVTGPEDGLGNWFALNAVSAEELKKIPEERNGERLSRLQRKATYLTDVRKIAVPARRSPNEIQLFDDGTHGDALAGDGVYSGTMTNTAKEGSYIMQVHASGPTAAGNSFDRDASLQIYLTPRIVASHIGITAVRVDSQESKLQRFQLMVTPKDALGNFLGPRYASAIKLAAEPQGRFLKMVDNLDGSYSQVLELPVGVSVSDVKIRLDAQDATLEFKLGDKLNPTGQSRIVWLFLLLLLVVVIVWILLRRRST